jgi:hypothetical protein
MHAFPAKKHNREIERQAPGAARASVPRSFFCQFVEVWRGLCILFPLLSTAQPRKKRLICTELAKILSCIYLSLQGFVWSRTIQTEKGFSAGGFPR